MKKLKNEITLGILVIIALLSFFILAHKLGGWGLGKANSYYALFDKATGLNKGTDITFAGVKVGRVKDIVVVSNRAKVELSVDVAIKLPKDSLCSIKSKSVLGEKYLELEAGIEKDFLNTGDFIEKTYANGDITEILAKVGQLFSELKPSDLQAFAQIISEIAKNKEKVSESIVNLNDVLVEAKDLAGNLNNILSDTKEDIKVTLKEVKRIVVNLDGAIHFNNSMKRLSSLLGEVKEDYPHLKDELARTKEELDTILESLPKNLELASVTLKKLNRVLDNLSSIDKVEIKRIIADLKKFLRKEGVKVNLM